jgi:DNA replication protein DnaC
MLKHTQYIHGLIIQPPAPAITQRSGGEGDPRMTGEFGGMPGGGPITPASMASFMSSFRCSRHDTDLVGGQCLRCTAERQHEAAERAAVLARWQTDDYETAHRAEDKRLDALKHWREVLDQFPVIRDGPAIQRPQRDQVRAWAAPLLRNGPPGNLVLSGDHGQGKTWDILHAVRAAYEDRFTGSAVYADRELWLQARPVSAFAEHDPDLLRQWQDTDLLVVDDAWGDSTQGERDADFLYLILNRRCNTPSRPTVLVTNLSDLRMAFGHAVWDRLRSPAVTVIQYRGGQSLRGRARRGQR